MVFQDYALFPHLTVYENIAFGIGKLTSSERASRVSELLDLINMRDYKDRFPYQLSGGQQQRVAVARALAPNPYLLLMDEPFSNIDSDLKQKIRQDIKSILKAENMTCIFVTHDKSDVEDMSDRTITITPAAQ
jgi:iron(III) transport system ATP-binding protein